MKAAILEGGLAIFKAPSRCLIQNGNKFESPVETSEGIITIDMNTLPPPT
jgi:hypothetical protein